MFTHWLTWTNSSVLADWCYYCILWWQLGITSSKDATLYPMHKQNSVRACVCVLVWEGIQYRYYLATSWLYVLDIRGCNIRTVAIWQFFRHNTCNNSNTLICVWATHVSMYGEYILPIIGLSFSQLATSKRGRRLIHTTNKNSAAMCFVLRWLCNRLGGWSCAGRLYTCQVNKLACLHEFAYQSLFTHSFNTSTTAMFPGIARPS